MYGLSAGVEYLLRSFVHAELAPWRRDPLISADIDQWLGSVCERHHNVFLINVENGSVTAQRGVDEGGDAGASPEAVRRAEIFRRLIEEAVELFGDVGAMTLALNVGDLADENIGMPIFSFQKRRGSQLLLLPDFEMVSLAYLAAVPADDTGFEAKRDMAFFAGSTSGLPVITMESLQDNLQPRVRAARFFANRDEARFLLPSIVQCASPEVEAQLRTEGFGDGRLGWTEGYDCKFQISIDGNGAPCSRPAIALRNRSALIKYASDYVLYYTPGLQPWLHYIPVNDEQDVVDVVALERAVPGTFNYVAETGTEFAAAVLSREPVLAYTHMLLSS